MYERAWLDTLDELQLTELYEQEHARAKSHRRGGRYGLANYLYAQCAEICNAIGRLYEAEAQASFAREQLAFDGMPSRIAPERRGFTLDEYARVFLLPNSPDS